MDEVVCRGIGNRDAVLANGHDFRVSDLVRLPVGKPQFKRLERLSITVVDDCSSDLGGAKAIQILSANKNRFCATFSRMP